MPRPPLVLALVAAVATVSAAASAAFTFDATTSDLVQQFRLLDEQGANATAFSYADDELPASIISRLTSSGLSFGQLDGLQQRALLWDSGYVVGPDGSTLVKIYTAGNASMADIGVAPNEYLSAGCTYSNCIDAFGREAKRSRYCNGDQIASVVRCAAEDVPGEDQDLSMWATGAANATDVPAPNIVRHDWVDDYSNVSYLVMAIHLAAPSAQPKWDACALSSGEDYSAVMIIPCDVYSAANSSSWTEPAPTSLMTLWLDEIAASSSLAGDTESDGDGFNLLFLIPILAGVLLLALFAVFVHFRRRRVRERRRMWETSDANLDTAVSSDYFSAK